MNELLQTSPVIPVMVIEHLDDAIPLAETLVDNGLKVLEITLRTKVAIDAIKAIKQSVPNAIVGSGTVINNETLIASLDAEVDFMVSPGVSIELIQAAKKNAAALLPGAATPSEVMSLLQAGFTEMKFFPAQAAGGIPMLKSIGGPLPQVSFCPTGGINLDNAKAYLELSNVLCVGGTWMLDKNLIANKDWKTIGQIARKASEITQ